MEVDEAIHKRRSVRAYEDRSVPEAVLEKILESARLAPSAVNYQPWHFIVVKDPSLRRALSEAPYAKFLRESPIVIVGCGDTKRSPKWCVIDVTIAMQNMVMTATSEGLGSCWIGSFNEDKVKEMLKMPGRYKVVALLALGYPREKMDLGSKIIRSQSRKGLNDIVSYDRFDG